MILGVLVALMPFLGFPSGWKNIFYIVFGLVIAALSFLLAIHKRSTRRPGSRKEKSNTSRKEIVQSDYVETEMPSESVSDLIDSVDDAQVAEVIEEGDREISEKL